MAEACKKKVIAGIIQVHTHNGPYEFLLSDKKVQRHAKSLSGFCQSPHDTNGFSHMVNHLADLQQSSVKRGHFMEVRA